MSREATIAEIYRAKVDSRTTDIGAILHFLDYRRAAQRTRKDKDNR